MTSGLQVVPTGQDIAERPSSGLALSFQEMTMRVQQLDQFYREVMQDGTDYGKIPGTDKPTLYQPGAQMLDQIFGLVATFEILPSSVVDWDRPIPFFHYVVLCRLVSRRTGETAAEGIGSANSHEDRYRWRRGRQTCPECGKETIGRSKAEYGGGYFCNAKNGGCGKSFKGNTEGARKIASQDVGRVENDDTASLENTLSKMAQKRAHVAATLNATGASRIFTQDIEDLPQFQQATVIQSSSRSPESDDAPFGSEDVKPAASTSSARTTAPSPAVNVPVASAPRQSTPARPVQSQPEPAPKEVTRARAMQDTPVAGVEVKRPTLIAQLAQNIRAQRDLGAEIRMPTGAELQALTDDQLREMVKSTGDALSAAAEGAAAAEQAG